MNPRILATLMALAGAAGAQTYITSPKGYTATEGSSNHNYMIFAKHEMRWQTVDQSHVGINPRPFLSVAWRRDGSGATSSTYATRTLTNFEFYMAHADFASTQKDDLSKNYKDTPVNCILKRNLVLPDRTTKPASAPAPWDIVLKLDKPFFYNGRDAFIWEVRYTANTLTQNYSCDYQAAPSGAGEYKSTTGTTVGTACTASGQTSAMSFSFTFYNHGSKFRLRASGSRLPKAVPVLLSVDAKNSNLTFPGLCAPLIAMPVVSFPLGNTSTTGSLSTTYVDNLPHNVAMIGGTLYFQLLAPDPGATGFPVALSYGKQVTIPGDPVPYNVTRYYHYKSSATSTTTTKSGPWHGGIVTRFGP